MFHPVLEALCADEFAVRIGITNNVKAIHRALERSEEVDAARLALYQGQIDEEVLRRFVVKLLQEYRPGQLFPFDVAIAAVAVIVESRPTRFADEFLTKLSRLQRPELPVAVRIGRECERIQSRLAGNISRTYTFISSFEMPDRWEEAPTLVEKDCEQVRQDVVYRA
jgi:hypothetical protein